MLVFSLPVREYCITLLFTTFLPRSHPEVPINTHTPRPRTNPSSPIVSDLISGISIFDGLHRRRSSPLAVPNDVRVRKFLGPFRADALILFEIAHRDAILEELVQFLERPILHFREHEPEEHYHINISTNSV